MSVLVRKPRGFEGFGRLHVPLKANDSPVTDIDHGRRVEHKLDAAALTALVFALENHHPVAGIDELLWLDPMVVPNLVVLGLDDLADLVEATRDDLAFPDTPNGPVQLDVRLEQIQRPVPIPSPQGFGRAPNNLHVLLRHRAPSIRSDRAGGHPCSSSAETAGEASRACQGEKVLPPHPGGRTRG